jgi:hypothetical protein
MARDVLGNTRCIVLLGVMRLEERLMRFPLLVLATAIVALACEKGAPLSRGTANLEPANLTPPSPAPATSAIRSDPAPRTETTGTVGGGVAPAALAATPAAIAPSAVPLAPSEPTAADPSSMRPAAANAQGHQLEGSHQLEGNGEPMDDVDDEDVSATDKSGVDTVAGGAADEAPSGPVDDSEGADIDIRE